MHEYAEKGWRESLEQLNEKTNKLKDDLLYTEN